MRTFDPRHPPAPLFCPGRTPGLTHLAASQVAFRDFITPQLDGLLTTTIAFTTVNAAHTWYSRELRPGLAACVIRQAQELQASSGPVRSAVRRPHVGKEAYELTAIFRLSSGGTETELWALAHYGRVVIVLQGFWFEDGVSISAAPLMAKVVARTPAQ